MLLNSSTSYRNVSNDCRETKTEILTEQITTPADCVINELELETTLKHLTVDKHGKTCRTGKKSGKQATGEKSGKTSKTSEKSGKQATGEKSGLNV